MARTFGVLERLLVENFDLVKLEADAENAPWAPHFAGTWTLQLEGRVIFTLPKGLVHRTQDFTEEEVAAMLFDTILEHRNRAVVTGYDYGRNVMQAEFRTLLGLEV